MENNQKLDESKLLNAVKNMRIQQEKSREEIHVLLKNELDNDSIHAMIDKVEWTEITRRKDDAEKNLFYGICLLLGGTMASFSKLGLSMLSVSVVGLLLFRIARKKLREIEEESTTRESKNIVPTQKDLI